MRKPTPNRRTLGEGALAGCRHGGTVGPGKGRSCRFSHRFHRAGFSFSSNSDRGPIADKAWSQGAAKGTDRRTAPSHGRAAPMRISADDEAVLGFLDGHPLPSAVCEGGTGRFLAVNRAAEEFFGYPRETLLGMSLLDLLAEPEPGQLRNLSFASLSRPMRLQEIRLRGASDTVHTVEMLWAPFQFRGGDALRVEILAPTSGLTSEADSSRPASLIRLLRDLQQIRLDNPGLDTWLERAARRLVQLEQVQWVALALVRPDGSPAGRVQVAGAGLSHEHIRALTSGPWPACFQRALSSPRAQKRRSSRVCEDCCLIEVCSRFDTLHVRLECRDQIWGVLGLGMHPAVFSDQAFETVIEDLAGNLARELALQEREREKEELLGALCESEEKFRSIFDNAAVALYRTTPDGRILMANPALLRMLGFDRFEDVARRDLNREGYAPGYSRRDFVERIERDGRVVAMESVWRRRDGTAVHVLESAVAVRDAGGKTLYYDGSAVDVTALKEAEARAAYLARFPELNPNPVLAFDPEARLLYANPAAAEVARSFGCDSIEALFPEDLARIVRDCLERNEPRLRVRTEHGGRTLSWSFYPMATHHTVHCYGGEVTQQLALEEQLRQAQKLETLGRLAGGVAHDFNNILTLILMNLDLLQQAELGDPSLHEAVQQIAEAVERATNLTRQLLAFSRRQKPQMRILDLNEVIGGLTKMLQRIIGEDITLQLRLHAGPAPVMADPGMLEQVLMNLVVNARDAMPQGGLLEIEVSTLHLEERELQFHAGRRPGAFIRLTVRDTGCGIPPAILPKIFEPFFTTKEVGKGTGLGLATVHGIVQQHDGWIEVESTEGRGTAFHIHLPRHEGPAGSSEGAVLESAVAGGHETILVVEDEPGLRSMVRLALGSRGYQVLEASDAPAALQLWKQHRSRVDLVLTDMIMPGGMTGSQLIETLRKDQPGLKAILMSGYPGEVASFEKNLRPGDRMLAKPFGPLTLARAVRECLDGRPG